MSQKRFYAIWSNFWNFVVSQDFIAEFLCRKPPLIVSVVVVAAVVRLAWFHTICGRDNDTTQHTTQHDCTA